MYNSHYKMKFYFFIAAFFLIVMSGHSQETTIVILKSKLNTPITSRVRIYYNDGRVSFRKKAQEFSVQLDCNTLGEIHIFPWDDYYPPICPVYCMDIPKSRKCAIYARNRDDFNHKQVNDFRILIAQ